MQLNAQYSGRFVKGWVGGSSIQDLASRSGGWTASCLCGFSVNDNVLFWTFQAFFGYC